mmetsp:Transcript_15554/g.32193  ORF Transcript_15554/g.32193 Transcript_15554/m.32193 type:complete len:112 (+) Transcript_15554:224-559(+)
MSASSKIPAKHVLRGILRRLKAYKVQGAETSSATVNYVLEKYRETPTDNQKQAELRKLAYDYMILRQDVDERIRLQRLDTGAENQLSPKEMSRRAAARAGLELPKLNPDLD